MSWPEPTRHLAQAVAITALVLAAAPVAGLARSALQRALGPRFAVLLFILLGLIAAGAVVGGLRRAVTRSAGAALRMGGALVAAGAYVAASGHADPAILAVELVHFVEYGVITALFHRAWRERAGRAAHLLAGLAAFLAGLTEEAYQWWLPARVGELRDVWLNGVAIGCALLFISGAVPPAPGGAWPPRAIRAVARLLAVVALALAAFVHTVHLGVVVTTGTTSFPSRFSADALDAAARDRAARWATAPPLERPARLSREDQYATEGLQHVQARNTAWDERDAVTAWHENLILERHFGPLLDAPSYLSHAGHRWAAGQRAEAERLAGPAAGAAFTSAAFPYPLYEWPPAALWALAVAVGALCVWVGARAGRYGVKPSAR